jgi:hypothetical protein
MADEVEIVETEDTITETVTAEERDLIDQLIDDLNDGVPGVIFDRDLIDTNRPGNWGSVFLAGQDDADWADGHLIDQVLAVDVWAIVSDRGSGVKRAVQAVLKQFCEDHGIGWRFVSRTYAADLDKFEWRWSLSVDGPLLDAADPEDEDEPDETEPTEPADPENGDEPDETDPDDEEDLDEN